MTTHSNQVSYTNSLDLAYTKIDTIVDSLSAIDKTINANLRARTSTGLTNQVNEIKNSVKIIKRELKGQGGKTDELALADIDTMIVKINLVETTFKKTIEKFRQEINALPTAPNNKVALNLRITQAATVLDTLDSVRQRANEKKGLLEAKKAFIGKPELPNFDRLLKILCTRNKANEAEYTKLGEIVEKIQLKNGTISQTEILLLKEWEQKTITKLGGKSDELDSIQRNFPKIEEQFKEFLQQLISEIEESRDRKIALLNIIEEKHSELEQKGFSKGDRDMHCAILLRQVLENPFDIPLAIDVLNKDAGKQSNVRRILADSSILIKPSKNTLNSKIEGLKLIRAQANAIPSNKEESILISGAGPGGLMVGLICSIQGKPFSIIESRAKTDEMRGNIVALGKEDSDGQLSILRLPMLQALKSAGEAQSADVKLLDFFGITDRLHVNKLIDSPDASGILSVRLEDLQKSMIVQLKEVVSEGNDDSASSSLIHYGVQIDTIKKDGSPENRATVSFKLTQSKSPQPSGALAELPMLPNEMKPSMVYVMEGARSATRDQLGIDVSKQSKRAKMAFSFFKIKKANILQRNKYSLMNYIKSVPSLLKALWNTSFRTGGRDTYEILFSTWGRAELLLQTPENHYFYHTVSSKEQQGLAEFEKDIKRAQTARDEWMNFVYVELEQYKDKVSTENDIVFNNLMDYFQPTNRSWIEKDGEERKLVFDMLNTFLKLTHKASPLDKKAYAEVHKSLKRTSKLVEDLERKQLRFKQDNVSGARKRQNVFGMLKRGMKLKAAKYEKTAVTDSQVQMADTNHRQIGVTHFYIGGDAESTTDPISGSGCRTTLLRTSIAASAFNNPARRDNPFTSSAFAWSSHLSGRSMREEGMLMRNYYKKGTERSERFLDIAVDRGSISKERKNFLLNMQGKLKTMHLFPNLKLSTDEISKLKEIQKAISDKYNSSSKLLSRPRNESILAVWQKEKNQFKNSQLTLPEIDIFGKAWIASMSEEAPDFTKKEMKLFKIASSKLAFERLSGDYVPEVDYVYLSVMIQQILAKGAPPIAPGIVQT
ncbi:MAG: hypothetical protein H0X29_07165 [Parachlamydiaceae bacterium]|nr:hypothetical protein [Parachlamydiaceae bacterium]